MKRLYFLLLSTVFLMNSCSDQKTESVTSPTTATEKSIKKGKATPPPELGRLVGKEAEAFYIGSNVVTAYYPIAFFEDLMRGRAAEDAEAKTGNPRSQVNQLGLVRKLRGPEYKQIATPNNDTYYAQSFCDVLREPLIFTIPKTEFNRYYVFQLWDPYGETFKYLGSRTIGTNGGTFALVGPAYTGAIPDNITIVKSPYNNFAIWGRIGRTDAPHDETLIHKMQDGLTLIPLSQLSNESYKADFEFSSNRVAFDSQEEIVGDLLIYRKIANALTYTPPKAQDSVLIGSLEKVGFKHNGTEFDINSLSKAQKSGLAKGAQFAMHLMDVTAKTAGTTVNGWRWSPRSGIMGDDYLFRAAWAKWYTGGNSAAEAIYMDGRLDSEGNPFDGTKRYVMHFEADQLPQVDAFWSLSMYDLKDGSFVDNEIDRYSIGDKTKGLTYNEDGSLTIYIQGAAPVDISAKANWLPTPQDSKFYMNLRLFNPDHSLQNGTWKPPVVQVVK